MIAFKLGTAKSGVPIKIIFILDQMTTGVIWVLPFTAIFFSADLRKLRFNGLIFSTNKIPFK